MKNITCKEFKKLVAENPNIKIVDVRSPAEYNTYHIDNSINIPIYQLIDEFDAIFKNNYEDTIVIYCNIGITSLKAIALIEGHDNKYNLFNLQGGINEWKQCND